MTEPTSKSREAIIESYATKAADVTRTVLTRGFATADGVKAALDKPKTWWEKMRTKVKNGKANGSQVTSEPAPVAKA